MNFRIIAKFALLLVFFGFFMPIACDANGFQLAVGLIGTGFGLLLSIMFISAVFGIIIGILLLYTKRNIKENIDWIVIFVCIISGILAFSMIGFESLQIGAYIIIIGWIMALCYQIISKIKKK